MARKCKEYALYKGENLLCIGTAKHIAEVFNINETTVRFYASPTYKKRLAQRKRVMNARKLIALD